MRKSSSISIMVILLGLASTVAQAVNTSYDSLYVFGDSYCDVGNIFTLTLGTEPAAPYYNGRYSNGPIWLDHVASFLGVALKPYLLGGTDYAFGGAWVTEPQSIPGGGAIPSVPAQVALYLGQHGGKADPNALYILEGGGNDILGTATGSPQTLGKNIAEGLADSERLLRQAGARNFVIPDLFNVGLLPAAAGNVSFATAASAATDKSLDQLLAQEQFLEGVHITRLNLFNLLNAVESDPFHFGFNDVTDPCLTTTVCANPYTSFFWDTQHPTVFGHAFFAVTMENALPR